jgi:hypothetical protein
MLRNRASVKRLSAGDTVPVLADAVLGVTPARVDIVNPAMSSLENLCFIVSALRNKFRFSLASRQSALAGNLINFSK